jgi:hypothetical protein
VVAAIVGIRSETTSIVSGGLRSKAVVRFMTFLVDSVTLHFEPPRGIGTGSNVPTGPA